MRTTTPPTNNVYFINNHNNPKVQLPGTTHQART